MIYVSYLVGVAPKHCFYRIFQRWGRPPLFSNYSDAQPSATAKMQYLRQPLPRIPFSLALCGVFAASSFDVFARHLLLGISPLSRSLDPLALTAEHDGDADLRFLSFLSLSLLSVRDFSFSPDFFHPCLMTSEHTLACLDDPLVATHATSSLLKTTYFWSDFGSFAFSPLALTK